MTGLTRGQLVIRSAVAAGALATGLHGAEAVEAGTEARFDPRNWESVRRQFALRRNLSHFAAFVLAAHPTQVRAAIAAHRKALDADPYGYLHRRQADLEAGVRTAAARHIGGAAEEIALTDSTTMGLGLLYGGLRLREGDEILTTTHDFYATHEALRLQALRSGAIVRKVPLYRNLATVSQDEIVDTLSRGLTPRTRVVAVTWVHSGTGLKLPIRRIAEALGGRAVLCVDAVHALGVEQVDVATLGCDFLVAGCHKWLAGPRGTGIVWGRQSQWADTLATIPSFDDGASYAAWRNGGPPAATSARTMSPGGYHSFEHRWALREAFAFHRAIGEARVETRIHALAMRLKNRLAEVRGVQLVTPRAPDLSAGIVCLRVDGPPAQRVVDRLLAEHRIVASVTPYATEYVRLGPGLYTSRADVDRAVRALAAIARP